MSDVPNKDTKYFYDVEGQLLSAKAYVKKNLPPDGVLLNLFLPQCLQNTRILALSGEHPQTDAMEEDPLDSVMFDSKRIK